VTIINCDMGEGFGLYKMGDDAGIKNKNWPKVTFGKARALTIKAGAAYDWLPFDRKYVIRPSLDYGIAYPAALEDPNWTTKFK
jgi:hypothetical protein